MFAVRGGGGGMSAKHTPGPWKAKGANPDGILPNEGRWDVVAPSFGSVAIIAGPCAGHDARLIAAAPDLLEALQELLSWSDYDEAAEVCHCPHYARRAEESEPGCMHTRAAAAIARAVGKS